MEEWGNQFGLNYAEWIKLYRPAERVVSRSVVSFGMLGHSAIMLNWFSPNYVAHNIN